MKQILAIFLSTAFLVPTTLFPHNAKEAGIDAVANHLTKKVGDYENSLGGEGSLAKIAIHAGIGCSAASAKGKDCGSGALGAGLAELQSEWLGSNGEGETFDDLTLQYSALAAAVLTGVDAEVAIASAKRVDEFNRRLHKSERKALKKELEGAKTQEERDALIAVACSLTKCVEGVSENDPHYAKLRELQDKGDSLKDSDIYRELGKYQKEGLFGYTFENKLDDIFAKHESIGTTLLGTAKFGLGVGGVAGGVLICAETVGVACAAGLGAMAFGFNTMKNGFQEMLYPHEYKEGERILDSIFNTDTVKALEFSVNGMPPIRIDASSINLEELEYKSAFNDFLWESGGIGVGYGLGKGATKWGSWMDKILSKNK